MGDAFGHDVALDSDVLDELSTSGTKDLLKTINDLRKLRVGRIVDLPQIVVVGDQSSGKSSVLEAISRVRFPTKGNVCTRFATELVLCSASPRKVEVTIIPFGSNTHRSFQRTSFDRDALPDIISEAAATMGIDQGDTRSFSRDILRVEITDPDVEPITLIDLPGFFHAPTARQSSADIEIARQLAEYYMKQSKSIILAVVSANHNLAGQVVVKEAKKHDPDRQRTIGLITKPDLTVRGSEDEEECLELIRGNESMHNLKLGWHVLRNRSEGNEAISADERDAQEENFFSTGAWSVVPRNSRGIKTLRKKLSRVLLEHIQNTLPRLIYEINNNILTRQNALQKMGRPRQELRDQRAYLVEIAERFERLATDGVRGRYSDSFFRGTYQTFETRKVRALIRNLNRAFHLTLATKGVTSDIEWRDENSKASDEASHRNPNRNNPPDYLQPFIEVFDDFSMPEVISESDMCKDLDRLAAANRGIELPGQPNTDLAFEFFKTQSVSWEDIAKYYLIEAESHARKFVEDLLSYIIPDVKTVNTLLVHHINPFFEKTEKIERDKLQEILRPYMSSYGTPFDTEFQSLYSPRIVDREASRIASLFEETFPGAFTDRGSRELSHTMIKQVIKASEETRIGEFGTGSIIAMAMTHYHISLKTFSANVVDLVVENCLISKLPEILTPLKVTEMSDEKVRELASESEEVLMERMELENEIDILSQSLKKCTMNRSRL